MANMCVAAKFRRNRPNCCETWQLFTTLDLLYKSSDNQEEHFIVYSRGKTSLHTDKLLLQ